MAVFATRGGVQRRAKRKPLRRRHILKLEHSTYRDETYIAKLAEAVAAFNTELDALVKLIKAHRGENTLLADLQASAGSPVPRFYMASRLWKLAISRRVSRPSGFPMLTVKRHPPGCSSWMVNGVGVLLRVLAGASSYQARSKSMAACRAHRSCWPTDQPWG